ncbi:hypothetical protein RF11_03010 [Thelohanellus kitauei]|uniref:Uncharacterized protein n=1 Tax=Thelohanellus kitauei TaxID=669202 RepID=A0A0C2IRU9_THEKT|nr:hypothetical protein RF11_03010 [Thelohanellus kitauei]
MTVKFCDEFSKLAKIEYNLVQRVEFSDQRINYNNINKNTRDHVHEQFKTILKLGIEIIPQIIFNAKKTSVREKKNKLGYLNGSISTVFNIREFTPLVSSRKEE